MFVYINFASFCQRADPRKEEPNACTRSISVTLLGFDSFFNSTILRDWNHRSVTNTSAASLKSFQNQLGSSIHNPQPAPTASEP